MKLSIFLVLILNLAYSYEWQDKREALRSISSILEIDKIKENYKEELKELDLYPKIDWDNFSRLEDSKYHGHIKDLLPYMLNKVKNKDISSHQKEFLKLLKTADKFLTLSILSEADKAIYSFLVEKLRIEEELKECSNLKSQYYGQEPLMRSQLDRVDKTDEPFLIKQLSDITKRIQYITIDSH